MAGEVVNRQVVVNIVADDVLKAQETLLTRQKKLNEEIKKTNDPKALADLNKQLKATEQQIDRNTKVLKGDLLPTYNQLTSAVKKYYAEWKKTGDPEVLKRYQEANTLLKLQKDQLNKVEGAAKGISNVSIFKSAFWANLGAGAIQGFFGSFQGFLSGSIDEALAADVATRRLESTLNNLGRSDAFDRMAQKAEEMAARFKYLDNDDVIGVFEKLIDYGKLTEKEMNDLLPVIVNFAAKSQIGIGEATDVVVKALEGNGKALKQYGINIKDAGSETERMNVVMTTLKEKVDGAADAFQNSAAGSVAVAKQQMANLKEEIGTGLIPIFVKLLSVVNQVVKGISVVFGLSSGTDDAIANLRLNSAVQGSANTDYSQRKKIIEDDLKFAKQRGIDEKKVLDEWIAQLKKDKADVDAKVKNAVAQGIFNGGDASKTRVALDTVGRQMALDRLLAEYAADKTIIGINDAGKTTPDKKEPPEKKVKELESAWQRIAKIQEAAYRAVQGIARDQKQIFAEADKFIKANVDAIGNGGIDPAQRIARFDRNRVAGLELQVQTTRGKQRLAAEMALLKEQERQELDNKELTENEKLLIEEQYRQRRKEAELNFLNGIVANIGEYANAILNVFDTIGQAQTARENSELERDRKANEKKEQNLQNRLRKGLISQGEYDRQIAAINTAQEKREKEIEIKQFNRNKRISIIQAIINGAQAASKTLAELGFPAAIPALAILAASIGAQIATINAQKPAFARGGKLGGRLHSEGGNPIMDGNGNKIAEIERGEGIINRRSMADGRSYTLSGTPSQIASTINGMHGGIRWESPARFINYAALNKRYYAAGGTFGGDAGNGASMDTAQLMDILSRLDSTLKRGVKAYTVLTDQEDAQTRLNNIRAEATMK